MVLVPRIVRALAVACLLPLSPASGADRIQPLLAWSELDTNGQVTTVDWDASVPTSLHAVGEAALGRYPFTPAHRDGTAVASRAWLTGEFVLREDGDDYVVSIRDVRAGPRVSRLSPPKWPVPHMMRASVVAEFVVGADGALAELRIDVLDGPQAFDTAVREALATWQFEPEQIDGVAIASTLCIPFRFTVGSAVAAPADASACRLPRNGVRAEGQSALWQEIVVTARSTRR